MQEEQTQLSLFPNRLSLPPHLARFGNNFRADFATKSSAISLPLGGKPDCPTLANLEGAFVVAGVLSAPKGEKAPTFLIMAARDIGRWLPRLLRIQFGVHPWGE